ncbi:MAG: hypothetical protein WC421_07755 [Elusimicrobiales bacterium]
MKVKIAVAAVGAVLLAGCSGTARNVKSIEAVKWVYEAPDAKQYESPEYMRIMQIQSADVIDESKVSDPTAARLNNCMTKARAQAGALLVNRIAPGIRQGVLALTGKEATAKVYADTIISRLPQWTPCDIRIGFTDKAGCYYEGALKAQPLLDAITSTYSEDVTKFVKKYINESMPLADQMPADELKPATVAQQEGGAAIARQGVMQP